MTEVVPTSPDASREDDAASPDAVARPGVTTTHTSLIQHRVLGAVEETAFVLGATDLLATTGPLHEFKNAEIKGLLNDAKRRLVTSKGAGVVFEARTVARAQHLGERFGVGLRASLSPRSNDPVDIFIGCASGEITIRLQLKTGADAYIRGAIRTLPDGVILLVPRDVPTTVGTERIVSSIQIDCARIDTPTRADLRKDSTAFLERLSRGAAPVGLGRVAKEALRESLLDGVVAAVFDLAEQVLASQGEQVDWNRTARTIAKTVASSSLGTFLAATHACSAVTVGRHSLDARRVFRTTRIAASVVPHAIDVLFDLYAVHEGKISGRHFARSTTQHAGAALAEVLAFKYLARLAARFGPFGQIVVMLGGGFLVSKFGSALGGMIFDALETVLGKDQLQRLFVPDEQTSPVAVAVDQLVARERKEERRRLKRAGRGVCEEPCCGRKHHARGMCSRHYQRWWRHMRRAGWRPASRGHAHRHRRIAMSVQPSRHGRRDQ